MSDNWRVYPPPSQECGLKIQNVIVTCILNVSKLVIAMFLSSGIFVISASIIRTALTLGSKPSTLTVNRWGIRETVVGVATVNLPILRPIFTKRFWTSGLQGSSGAQNYYEYHTRSENYNLTSRSRKGQRNDSTTGINTTSQDGKDDTGGVYVSTSYNVRVESRGTPEAQPVDGQTLGLNPSSVWEIDKKSMV
ncbi:hypothetical protein P170DRAFT_454607 [Aspergillus steynii IBT 23096]|uniref:Integral membrane protein n=1 Tax=Aspergillus steynii IBT 23096 TaxID=1392250 RepID=A0A2I2GAJ8_9EURO|nr:uncharacterized protein P170DRAFT_454607 [Aspergillus steynii IBT 23096]PLB49888.1 hypothetical protein P170DRAFT_454607 [Aspergillus steynii IBT 23096]